MVTGKLLQLAGGAVYDANKTAQIVHNCKIDAFTELIESLNGEHALVFYGFQHERDRIIKALGKRLTFFLHTP